MGLRLMLSYQHEMAVRYLLASLEFSPDCALSHGFIALCHSPNYNFKGEAYYVSANHPEDAHQHDLLCVFPSQQVAERHSKMAIEKIDELKRLHRSATVGSSLPSSRRGGKRGKGKSKSKGRGNGKNKQRDQNRQQQQLQQQHAANQVADDESNAIETPAGNSDAILNEKSSSLISDVEVQLLLAIRILTCNPGLNHELSDEIVGRPYANAMRRVYVKYPHDPDVAYCFAEALMVMNAWQLYEYPTGKPVGPDVEETRHVLIKSLRENPNHAGLCHMYVHLSEMSANPQQALNACLPLRKHFPDAGHLIHMPTHIDVLVGDYESCVRYNCKAIEADERIMKNSPGTAGRESFYFGYIVHDYHMVVYGSILGGYEKKGMEVANQLNCILNEQMFQEYPDLTSYLEAYSALDIHLLVRFGRWNELIAMEPPKNQRLMLFKACSLRFAQCIAHASLGNITEAKRLLKQFDSLRGDPESDHRILHNNTVGSLFAVDAAMARGEIAYREGHHDDAFAHLRKAVRMQDNLNYDEPWGKMQPIRHALGGLLLEQGHSGEAERVFRKDLEYHPNNPWALAGLIRCLKMKSKGGSCCVDTARDSIENDGHDIAAPPTTHDEITTLQAQFEQQRQSEWADFDVVVSCACCTAGIDN